jgi:hypothetical protein
VSLVLSPVTAIADRVISSKRIDETAMLEPIPWAFKSVRLGQNGQLLLVIIHFLDRHLSVYHYRCYKSSGRLSF